MKKCPQCGTILEETKKKCYMCGAELQKIAFGDFGDAFDEQVGATISNGQDNVFNGVSSVMSGFTEPVADNTNNQVTFTNAMSSAPVVQQELGENAVPTYDNRTSIEKIFSNDARFQNYDGFNLNATISTPQEFFTQPTDNIPASTPQDLFVQPTDNIPASTPTPPPEVHTKKNFINEEAINKKVKEKPSINWGDNLKGGLFGNKDGEEGNNNGFKFNLNTIFNIGSIVFFVVAVVFLYFKFLAPKEVDTAQKFAGLTYDINKDFIYAGESGPSRSYTYGYECALKINYGTTVETDGFLDNYFEKVKNSYPDLTTKVSEIKVNGNVWTEVSVIDFIKNDATTNGYAEVLKYKYVTIVHKGNFYDIVFANDSEDNKCSAMFNQFMESVEID